MKTHWCYRMPTHTCMFTDGYTHCMCTYGDTHTHTQTVTSEQTYTSKRFYTNVCCICLSAQFIFHTDFLITEDSKKVKWVSLDQERHSTAWIRAVSCESGLLLAWVGLVETEFWLFVAWLSSRFGHRHTNTNISPLFFFWICISLGWLIRAPYLMHTKWNKILYIKVPTHTSSIK